MERYFNWNGLLIEANQANFQNLLSRKRKSWMLPVCLSLKPYPTQVCIGIYSTHKLGFKNEVP